MFSKGWTFNYDISLFETAQYWEAEDDLFGESRYCDESTLAFGWIWVQYEDGSRQRFRHKSGWVDGYDSVYTPDPENGSGDYIVRTTTDTGDGAWEEIDTISYALYRRDGTVIDFEVVDPSYPVIYKSNEPVASGSGGDGWNGQILDEHNNQWSISTRIKSKTDKFGNRLDVEWHSSYVVIVYDYDKIPGNDKQVQIVLAYAANPPAEHYWNILLFVDEAILKKYVRCTFANNLLMSVQEISPSDSSSQRNRTEYEYNNSYYPALEKIWRRVEDVSIEKPTTQVSYDMWGRLSTRIDGVDEYNYLQTNYLYQIIDPYPDNGNDDDEWLYTVTATPYKADHAIYDNRGRVLSQFEESANALTKFRSYEYPSGEDAESLRPEKISEFWYDYDYDVEPPLVLKKKETEYEYTSCTFYPDVDESYPDELYGQEVTALELTKQTVSDSDGKIHAYNETQYREYPPGDYYGNYYKGYSLPSSSKSYQVLDMDPDDEDPYDPDLNTEVCTRYEYGDHNGAIDTSDYRKNNHLIKRKVVTSDPQANERAVSKYTYDEDTGLLKTETDPEGNRTLYEYDEMGNRTFVKVGPDEAEEPTERSLYNKIGQMLLKADHNGLVTKYHYNGFGDPCKVETFHDPDALDTAVSFVESRYTPVGSGGVIWPPRSTTEYGYDIVTGLRISEKTFTDEQVVAGQDDAVVVKRIEYTEYSDQPRKITFDDPDPDSEDDSFVLYYYDGRGLKLWEGRYDATNQNIWFTDYCYDGLGRLIITDWWDYENNLRYLDPSKTVYTGYNGSGQKAYEDAFHTDIYGWVVADKMTEFKYDIMGKTTDRIIIPRYENGEPELLTTSYTYDGVGNLTSTKDPEDNYVFRDYDNANRQTKTYFAEVFDGDLETTKSNAKPRQETAYYANNLVKDANSYDYDYDDDGKAALLEHTRFYYDQRNRVNRVSEFIALDGNGDVSEKAETTYAYEDAKDSDLTIDGKDCSNVTVTKKVDSNPANDKTTIIAYNERGQKLRTEYPSGDKQQLRYNGDGSVKERAALWSGGEPTSTGWVTYDNDIFHRLQTTTYPDSGTVTFEYDGFGRKIKFTDTRKNDDSVPNPNPKETTYEYDTLNRISKLTDHNGYDIRYSYTGEGKKETIEVTDEVTEPTASKVIYSVEYYYDMAGRLKYVIEPELELGSEAVAGFEYDTDCGCQGISSKLNYYLDGSLSGDITTIDYTYNADNYLTGYTTTGGPTFSFDASDPCDIDGLGRLVEADEQLTMVATGTRSHTITYEYDMKSEVTLGKRTNVGALSWVEENYDFYLDGNIYQSTTDTSGGNGTPVTYTYTNNGDSDMMLSDGTFTLAWSDNGNMTTGATSNPNPTMEYNWDNKLRKATNSTAGTEVAFRYDPDGNRVFKLYDDGSDPADIKMYKYLVDPVGPLPVVLMIMGHGTWEVQNSFIYDDKSRILAQYDGDWTEEAGAEKYFYLNDHLGSVRLITDDTGTPVSRYTYDPYGNTIDDECEIDADLYNPFMYTGQWYDEEIGQYYLRARYYDPYIGRFSNRDPACGALKYPMTLNVYLYALNNPINRIDPTGRFSMLGPKKKAESFSQLMSFRGATITAVVNSTASMWEMADALLATQNSIATVVLDSMGSHSVGWEFGFLLGGIGKTKVTCHNGQRTRYMVFEKACFGLMLNLNMGLSALHGMDGPNCKPESYSGWFFEAALGTASLSADIHIGIEPDPMDPTNIGYIPTGVWEHGGSVGIGAPLKGGWCKYKYVGDE
jgi:RHS repeat-associated protein